MIMKKFTTVSRLPLLFPLLAFLTAAVQPARSQVIRPFTKIYSENLKGAHVMFGNGNMAIYGNNGLESTKMNETSDAANGSGGVGFSQYGNDNDQMEFASIERQTFIDYGANWKYFVGTLPPPADWNLASFDDAAWLSGPAELGFGDGDEATTTTTDAFAFYFRRTVNIANPGSFANFSIDLKYDDGAVIYVNGIEVSRVNMPGGTFDYSTAALSNGDNVRVTLTIPSSGFVAGNNLVAVEIHKISTGSLNNMSFQFRLSGNLQHVKNSSSADLVLPVGTNVIKFARIYWGAKIFDNEIQPGKANLLSIKIRKGTTGAYTIVTIPVAQLDETIAPGFTSQGSGEIYQCYSDITSFIASNGAGTYTVADIAASTGSALQGGMYAGWSIVVVYENSAMPYNSIRLYDGFLNVYNGGSVAAQSITLDGLDVPSNPLVNADACISVLAWEGDANLHSSPFAPAGDYFKINGTSYQDAVNPVTNIWNGSISRNGTYVTAKNANFSNQMGMDLDEFAVGMGYGINPDDKNVSVEFGTQADQYLPSVFAFTIRMKDPTISIDKTVVDNNHSQRADPGETLTYTLSGTNGGLGNAYNSVIVDTLPAGVTYVPNSLEIIQAPGGSAGIKTDAANDDVAMFGTDGTRQYVKFFIGTGATANSGGTIAQGEQYVVRFKIQVTSNINLLSTITNTARITAKSQANEDFVDDGTAIMLPQTLLVAPLKLLSFSASPNQEDVNLQWSTSSEINTSFFEVQRSYDAASFEVVGKVQSANRSNGVNFYDYTDRSFKKNGLVYYRLRMVDVDGAFSYSKVISIRLTDVQNAKLSAYPNPFINDFTISLRSDKNSSLNVQVINLAGQLQTERSIRINEGNNIVNIANLGDLKTGIYFIRVTGDNINFTQKMMKQ